MSDLPATFSDHELMLRVQTGEANCFDELVLRYQSALLRVARSRLGRSDWAEDVVQEAFLSAFRSRHTFRAEFSFRTWLWTILLNQCRAHAARRSRWPQVVAWSDEPQPPTGQREDDLTGCSEEPAPWDRLLAQERTAQLESLLARLSQVQADALRLRFFGGLKFQEIADTMGCSLGTAKNRVQWGLLQLSKWVSPHANLSATPLGHSLNDHD